MGIMTTIVVVGHGRSPEGKGWGSKIDSCSVVIRLWDWFPWQGLHDYGAKYDYGLFTLTPRQLPIFMEQQEKPTPRWGWLAYQGKPTSGVLPPKTEVVDPSPWVERGKALGGVGLNGSLTLTRGCVAAAWAIQFSPRMARAPVVLVGFDNVLAQTNRPIEESFCPEYWKLYNARFAVKLEKAYPTGQAKTATHDMEVELPLLQKMAVELDVPLQFAQDVW